MRVQCTVVRHMDLGHWSLIKIGKCYCNRGDRVIELLEEGKNTRPRFIIYVGSYSAGFPFFGIEK
jgi:hypothetical protein